MKRFFRQHRGTLILSALASVSAAGLGLVPYFAVHGVAAALAAGAPLTWTTFGWWTGIALAAVGLKALLAAASTHLSHVAAYGVLHAIRMALIEKLARLPIGYFTEHPSGTLKKAIVDDVDQIEDAIAHAIPDLAAGIAVPLLSGLALAFVDWRLGLASMAMLPILLVLYPLSMKAAEPFNADYFGALSRLKASAVQYIQGMKVIRAFLRSDRAFADFGDAVSAMAAAGERQALASLTPMSLLHVGLRANVLVLLPAGGLLYLSGGIGAPDLILFLLVGMGMNAPVLKVMFTAGSFWWRIHGASAAVRTILDAPELQKPSDPHMPQGHGISLRGVSFAYGERKVLDGLDLTAEEGRFTAIVGPSGAGKSTITRLIARFWDVTEGCIEVGGVDIRDIGQAELMRMTSFVLQDAWLINDTIRVNILSGRPDASAADVTEAARLARVEDFAADLPDGLDTIVGEGGRLLSGGQRQRVAIARAMLRDAPILVFDEATAALDPDNEALVVEALAALAKGRTVIAVAHRLDTIRKADRIVYVDNGRVLATGGHAELLERCGDYARLWRRYEAVADWTFDRSKPPTPVVAVEDAVPTPAMPDHLEHPIGTGALGLFLRLVGEARGDLVRRALPLLLVEGLLAGAPVVATWLALRDVLDGRLTATGLSVYTSAVALCLAAQVLCNRASHRVLWHIQMRAVAGLQNRLADHLRRVPLGVLFSRDTGAMETLLTQRTSEMNFVTPPAQVTRLLAGPFLALLVMLFIDWRLALAAVAFLPVFAMAVRWGDGIYRKTWIELAEAQECLSARVLDYVQGMPTLRSIGMAADRFRSLADALARHRIASLSTVAKLTPCMALGWTVLDLGFCALLAIGGAMAVEGMVPTGTLMLFLVVGLVFYGPVADVFDLVAYRRMLERSMRSIADVLDLPVLPEPIEPQRPAGLDVAFEDVRFSYGDRPALRGVTFSLEAGKLHALVGPSGSGKSTIMNLLARFWDVDGGRITVGGVDLRDLTERTRQQLFSVVFQDSYLFDDTVEANLRLGNPQSTDDEVRAAAQAAYCHDFITALEGGYTARVGEGGNLLSGGQRQRIAIARAILKDAPIVLLDEAMASVDPDSEFEIRQGLSRVCSGKTVVMIAHRPQSILNADRIITLDAGELRRT